MSSTDPKLSSGTVATPAAKSSEGDRASRVWAKDAGAGAGASALAAPDGNVDAPVKRVGSKKLRLKGDQDDEQSTASQAVPGDQGRNQGADGAPVVLLADGGQGDRSSGISQSYQGDERAATTWGHQESVQSNWASGDGGLYALLGGGLALGVGMGGGGGDNGAVPAGGAGPSPLNVVVQDGLIKDASVYVDENFNRVVDGDEVKIGTTDANGRLVLADNTLVGDLLITGGVNADTNLPNTLTLSLRDGTSIGGAVVVSPLTTLVAALFDAEVDPDSANAIVRAVFGLPDSINLSTYNPYEVGHAGTEEATLILRAGAALATIGSASVLADDAFAKIAEYVIDHPNDLLDLGELAVLKAIFNDASDAQLQELADISRSNADILQQSSAKAISDAQLMAATPVIVGLVSDTGISAVDLKTADARLLVTGLNQHSAIEYSVDHGVTWANAPVLPTSGKVSVQARLHYDNGTNSGVSNEFTFELAPLPPPLPLQLFVDSGASSTDSVTNVGTVQVGQAALGAVIEYSTDGQKTWSSSFTASVDGAYDLYVRQNNPVTGAISITTELNFVFDTVAKAGTAGLAANEKDEDGNIAVYNDSGYEDDSDVNLAAPTFADGVTHNPLPKLAGKVDEINPSKVIVDIGGETYTVVPPDLKADGTWTIQITKALADGVYRPLVTVTDAAGNTSAPTAMAPMTIDTLIPDTDSALLAAAANDTGAFADDGFTTNRRPTIEGHTQPNSIVLVNVDGEKYVTHSDDKGFWSVAITKPLLDGEYTPLIAVVDGAGNVAEDIEGTIFTVDNIAPTLVDVTAALLPDDDLNDTGVAADDGITSNNSPTVAGSVGSDNANAMVSIKVGDQVINTQANEDGEWVVDFVGLADGTYTPIVTVTDLAGNKAEPKAGAPFTIDTQAPVEAVGDLVHDQANDTGISVDDSLTANSSPTFAGTADPGALVVVSLNDEPLDEVIVADAAGHWSVTLSDLADGEYTPVFSVTDLAGNVSETAGALFVIDTTPPEAPEGGLNHDEESDTGVLVDDSITNNNAPFLSGLAEPDANVRVEILHSIYEVQADSDGNWTVELDPLADGEYTPVITVTDAAGNQSDPFDGATFAVDTRGPSSVDLTGGLLADDEENDTGVSSEDGITSNNAPILTGTAQADAVVMVDVDGTIYQTQAGSDGVWTVELEPLSDGEYTPFISVTDEAGNASEPIKGTPFTIDTEGPDAGEGELLHDAVNDTGFEADDNLTANNLPVLSGSAAAGAQVRVLVADQTFETQADESGEWTIAVDSELEDGEYTPVIQTVDDAGNITETDGTTFIIDTTPIGEDELSFGLLAEEGNDTGAAADDGITNNASPTVAGTSEPSSVVWVTLDGQRYLGVQADDDGNWAVTFEDLPDGEYTPSIITIDVAGNESDPVEGASFAIDSQAPTAVEGGLLPDESSDTGESSEDGITNATGPTLEGYAEAGALVSVDLNGEVFEAQADDDGYWVLVAEGMSDGEYTPLITVTDIAGNASDAFEGSPFVVDTQAPEDASGGLVHDDEISDTGLDPEDGITNNNAPVLAGTAEAGAAVHIDLSGQVFDTVADEEGNWALEVDSALDDGEYTPLITVTDRAGNSSTVEGATFVIDTEGPSGDGLTGALVNDDTNDTGASINDGITNNNSPTLAGLAPAGALVMVDIDGQLFQTEADDEGAWSVTLESLDDGEYTPLISVTDVAGNLSDSIEGTPFVIDTQGPDAAEGDLVHDLANDTGIEHEDNITNNSTPTLEGIAEPGLIVRVEVNGEVYEALTNARGAWTVKIDNALDDGEYTPLISVVDEAGNVTESEGAMFIVDTEAPTSDEVIAALAADEDNDTGISQEDGITRNNAPMLSGAAPALATVHVQILHSVYETQADDDGNWSVELDPMADGEYQPLITVTDAAGNASDAIEGAPFTIDTRGPSAFGLTGGLTSDEENDTGLAQDDGLTNNPAPLLSGTADAGAVVLVEVDGITYQTLAEDDGTWAVQLEELADGEYVPIITLTDSAGNAGEPIEGTPFTIDTQGPDAAEGGLVHDEVNDSGFDSTDGVTALNTPVFSGVGVAGAMINVVLNDQVFESVVDDDGTWTVAVDTPLDDGEYVPIIQAIDEAGNISESEGEPFTIDTTAPTQDEVIGGLTADEDNDTGIAADDGMTRNNAPTLTGTAEALSAVSVDVGGLVYDTQADEDGNWSVNLNVLEDGEYIPVITATDLAGNVSEVLEGIGFTIDTLAPVEASASLVHDEENDTGVSSEDGLTNNSAPLMSGQVDPMALVSLDLNGAVFETQADEDGYWELVAEGLSDGNYIPIITATDLAGNVSDPIEGTPFTLDTEGPDAAQGDLIHDELNDTGVASDDGITSNNQPSFSGTATANDIVRIELNGQQFETVADTDGHWTIQIDAPLDDGEYQPLILAVDEAGNITEEAGLPFTIDTQAPTADEVFGGLTHDEDTDTGVSSEDGITNNGSPTLSGSCDPLFDVTVEVDGKTYDTQADESGNWAVALDALGDGEYTPSIIVTDAAGNRSDAIDGETFTIDTQGLTLLGIFAGLTADEESDTGRFHDDGLTNNNAPTLNGISDPLSFLKIDVDGTIYEAETDEDGNWTVALDTLPDGQYTPIIIATDAAGNESAPVDGTPFIIDTQGPDGAEGALLHDALNDTGLELEDGLTSNNQPTLVGVADAGAIVQVDLNGLMFETTADDSGAWAFTVDQPLEDGEYVPVISVFDDAGNATATEGEAFVIDTQGATADEVTGGLTQDEENDTGLASDDGLTSNKAPTLSGTVDPMSLIRVEVGGVSYDAQADESGNWSLSLGDLEDGEYTPLIVTTDAAGNESEQIEGTPFVIDTQAPNEATAELQHDVENDTGVSEEDGLTNNASPVISGTTGPLSLVSVDLNGSVFEAAADEDGNWQIVADGLGDGEFTPLITVTDPAGNVSAQIEGTLFVVDTVGPEVVEGDLIHDEANDTGISLEDGITANNMPVFTGLTEAGNLVRLNIGGTVFETDANDDGEWTIEVDRTLKDGTYIPIIQSVDAAGNVTEAEAAVLIIDTQVPVALGVTGGLTADEENDTGLKSNDSITNNNAPILSGKADAGSTVRVDVDGTVFETVADDGGIWELALETVDDGTYLPLISVTDAAGNESLPIVGRAFTVDTQGPSDVSGGLLHNAANDTGVALDDGFTRNAQPTLAGIADAGSIVLVDLNSLIYQAVTDATGNWSLRIPLALADGEYTPLISVTDVAGNGSDQFEGELIVVDTAITGVTGGLTQDEANDTGTFNNDGVTNNNVPTLSGTAEANAAVVVKLNGVAYATESDSDGLWSVAVEDALADGVYTPSITVTDLAGNVATVAGSKITVDTVGPTSGGGIGPHITLLVGDQVSIDIFGATSGNIGNLLEDYSGNLPEGLEIDSETQQITGTALAAGTTWMTKVESDLAGNLGTSHFQLAATIAEKSVVTINGTDPEKINTFFGSGHLNVYSSAGDVYLASDGDDLFQMFRASSMNFSRADGGGGTDTMKIYGVGLNLDFSAFNNPDGANPDGVGWVLERVEAIQFADKGASATISASDIFHMKSDLFDVDGVHQMVRLMASSTNGGEVTIDGLTQVGKTGEFSQTGGKSTVKLNDIYTKFYGTYTDETGDHLVALLLQNGLSAA